MSVVRAVEQDFSADADAGNVRHIHLHLVHTDAADDGSTPAFNQNFAAAGEPPGQAIVITEGNDADFGSALRGEGAVIAQGFARGKLLYAGDAAGDADGQLQ